jgi:hypothetical protein
MDPIGRRPGIVLRESFDDFLANSAFYAAELGGHVVGAAVMILGMRFIEWLIKTLWPREPVLFAGTSFAFPLTWLFNLADAVLLAGFLALAGSSFLLRLQWPYGLGANSDQKRQDPAIVSSRAADPVSDNTKRDAVADPMVRSR